MAPPRKTQVRFRERAELLDFLLEVSSATAETLDLDVLLANVADIIKEVIPHDLFAILLYNERIGGLKMRYSIGHRDEVARNLVIQMGEGITGASAASRQPILAGDVRADPRYLSALDAVRAELTAPMLVRGKLVGVIDLQSTRLNAFSEQDRALLTLIATRVAFSIDNARLYRRVERQGRLMRVLAHLSQEFSSILDLDELLTKIAVTVRALINFEAFSIFLLEPNEGILRQRFSQRYDDRAGVDHVEMGAGIVGAAAASRESIRVGDTLNDPRYIAVGQDTRSEVSVPLILRDRVVGVMDLESTRLNFFTEDHLRALTLLAPQIASSVENARLYQELAQREQRMEQDLKAAFKLQSVLLPRNAPDIIGLNMAVKSRPAREISGDLYDFFELRDDYTLIAFGDVSGKGAAAALYGALVSGLLRTLAPRRRSPAQLMKDLNEALLERKVDAQYVTLLLLLWDARTRTFAMAGSGVLPPMVCRKGKIVETRLEGVPLGMLEDQDYEQVQFAAEPDDYILLYSDGIEDQLHENAEYGRDRLIHILTSQCGQTPCDVVQVIFEDIDAFRGATPLTDDQTIIAMKVE
ncbi:MAG TPA: SpoIIE family protein phosphatase [Bryobacteraceae bacterium]|jgi:sigma-B regulation protein RsbU (phosphoserine phosphatase)|nr:SpoIIE family protein phosphatase [Bryobacteraceae bacterium]